MDLIDVTRWRTAADRSDLTLTPGERVVAGGTWLFSEPQPEVTGLVDLTTLKWQPWEALPDGGLRIGATCTVAEIQAAPLGAATVLATQCADSFLMSFKVQQAATVGGNLCLALPAGAMISLTAALGADAVVWTPDGGQRREPVTQFVRDVLTTSLAPGEILRAVDVPASALAARYVLRRIALTELGRASAVVIGRRDQDGSIQVTVSAATVRPYTLTVQADGTVDAGGLQWYSDAHGSRQWRAAMAQRFAAEVVEELTR
ncbi:FAD binding domain-containing protein [soil metagenome]